MLNLLKLRKPKLKLGKLLRFFRYTCTLVIRVKGFDNKYQCMFFYFIENFCNAHAWLFYLFTIILFLSLEKTSISLVSITSIVSCTFIVDSDGLDIDSVFLFSLLKIADYS